MDPSDDESVHAVGAFEHTSDDTRERLTDLARRALTLAYEDPEPATMVNVSDVARRFERIAMHLLGPTIDWTLSAHDETWIASTVNQLELILLNLIVYSRDATDAGGRVTAQVTVERLRIPLDYVHGFVPPGWWVCLRVTDTGHSASANMERRMSADRAPLRFSVRHGFGLAPALLIVRRWRGHVRLESRDPVGMTVTCFFPARRVGV